MSQFPRLRLALPVLLAIILAGGTPAIPAEAAPGFEGYLHSDQSRPPPQEGTALEHDPLGLEDDPAEAEDRTLASGLFHTDARRSAILGRSWRGSFRHFVIPFETGPPSA